MDEYMYQKIVRVLHALERCGMDSEFAEDCGDCPYRDDDDEIESRCIARMARDARTVILKLDRLLQQMTDPNTVMIDKTSKPVQGLRYCQSHRECYGADHKCPYQNQEDCIGQMQTDLARLIDRGEA